jgi:NodT family efflux transporter outer membrane factor (OMF) lipoprotein
MSDQPRSRRPALKATTMARLISLTALAMLAACSGLPSVGPDYRGPPPDRSLALAESPASVKIEADRWQAPLPHAGSNDDLARWWQQFNDPALDAFIAAAERESGTIARAAANIERARAITVAAQANALPAIDASALANRGTLAIGTSVLTVSQQRASVLASWEIDLFGRIRREQEAAGARLSARTDNWHEARVSVAAEAASDYLQYRFCQSLVAISQSDLASRTETSAISQRAAAAGFQAPAAAALARASAAEAASRLTGQQAECDVIIKAMVALTGLDEPAVRALLERPPGGLPVPREFAVNALPAGLLMQRPDLAAAERELAAASADIGVAVGDQYPRLSLTGSIGPVRLETGSISANFTNWSLGPAISLPIFDAGRRAANVEATRAAYVAAESEYRARVRGAVREVEEALVRLQSSAARDVDARTASQGYRDALDAAQVRWRNGLGSLLDLEEARRFSLVADSSLASVRRDRVAAWVALYRALGGGWTNSP